VATPLLSPVPAPPAAPPRGGLLAASVPGPDTRWLNGVVQWPESAVGWELSQDCSTETVSYGDPDGGISPLAGVPFVIRTSVICPRTTIEDMSARARTRLDSITSRAIAREVWTGDETSADPYDLPGVYDWLNPSPSAGVYTNPYLTQAGADTVGGAGLDVLGAMGAVEAEVGQRVTNGPVFLHCPVAVVNDAAWALERRGDLLVTMTGAVVVTDYGYPLEATPVIYGTGTVQTWTGPIAVDDEPGEVVSKEDNTVRVWAERPALYLFDPRTLVSCQVTG
jgi:hypothetical protein